MKLNINQLLKQTFWIYLLVYLTAPISYLIRILYARNFVIEEFGLIYAILGFLMFLSIFNDLGFSQTLNYYGVRFYEKKDFKNLKGTFLFSIIMQGISAILIITLLYFLAPFLAKSFFKINLAEETLQWFFGYFFFINLIKPFILIFNVLQKYHFININEFLRNLFVLIISSSILFFPKFSNVKFIGFVWSISLLIIFIIFLILFKIHFKKIYLVKANLKFSLFKKLSKYAFYTILGDSAMIFLSRIDIILLTVFTNLTNVGLYSVALSLGLMISLVINPVMKIIFPLTSKLDYNKESAQIKKLITSMYQLGLYITIPFLIMLITFPKEIINIMFGREYLQSATSLIILSLAFFLYSLNSFNFNIISGIGKVKERAKIIYYGALINTIGNVILIPLFNIVGAAIATLISIIIMLSFSLKSLKKHFSFYLEWDFLKKMFFLNMIIFIIIKILKKIILTNVFIELLIIGLTIGIIYLIGGQLLKIINFKKILNFLKESKSSRN